MTSVSGLVGSRCSICGVTERVEFHKRPRAQCIDCGALERQRALVRIMGSALTNGAGRQALEAGPLNRRVFGDFLRARGWRYVAIDRFKTAGTRESHAAPLIDHQVDLVDLAPLSDASFDLFLAQHVLEEIEDYERALDEIARVLRPGGLVAVEIPFDPQREVSRRHPADKFGNVWAFGADLPRVVARRFARTEVLNMEEAPYSGRLLLCVR